MLRLKELGWGARRIARELGVSRNTVKGYVEAGGRRPYRQPARGKKLSGQESWLKERFARHRGNADVIRQELAAEKGIVVSLRTIERAVEPYRRELAGQARATARFETAAGQAAPDRLWRASGRDRRRQDQGLPVCRDARLCAAAACASVPQ